MTTAREYHEWSERLRAFLKSLFRDGSVRWPFGEHEAAQAFIRLTHDEGVQPLLNQMLGDRSEALGWPVSVREVLQAEARKRAALESVWCEETRVVLDELRSAGLVPLLMKGFPLAYLVYPEAYLRPCIDIDLLVRFKDLERVTSVLSARGYQREEGTGERALRQVSYTRPGPQGARHMLDVHWAVSHRALFARMLPYEALRRDAVPVPALGPYALSPGLGDALLVSCVHQVGHHAPDDRLIWLYDVYQLLEHMTADERQQVVVTARARQVCAIVARRVEEAEAWFGGEAAAVVRDALNESVAEDRPEVSALYLKAGRSRLDELRADLSVTESWSARCGMLWATAFPSARYMRARYGSDRGWLLPFLYLRRITSGLARWVRPRASRRPG